MPLNALHSRIEAVENRLDEHIHDGIDVWTGLEEVRNDVKWIKWSLWGVVSLATTLAGLLVRIMFIYPPIRP